MFKLLNCCIIEERCEVQSSTDGRWRKGNEKKSEKSRSFHIPSMADEPAAVAVAAQHVESYVALPLLSKQ